MGLTLQKFPEQDLVLRVVCGSVPADEVFRSFAELDASWRASLWLTYVDIDPAAAGRAQTEAMDTVPVDRLPELKRLIRAKHEELFGDKRAVGAVVCHLDALREITRFWSAYVAPDRKELLDIEFFTRLEEAFDWLGLPADGRAAVQRAIDGQRCGRRPDRLPRLPAPAETREGGAEPPPA